MNWRKTIAFSFIPLIAFLLFIRHEEKPEPKRIHRTVASKDAPKKNKTLTPSVVASLQGKAPTHKFLRNRIPQSVEMTLQKDPDIHLTKGHEFLKDVAAIPKNQYRPDMGEVLQQNDHFVFFRTSEHHEYIPVAISKMTNTLYPISSVLHIKGATKDLRSSLLSQGFEEYYYHAPLKFLSIKSEAGQVMKVYSELEKQGYNVQLEVLKPGHQTI